MTGRFTQIGWLARGVLLAGVVLSVGCIIPTPLDSEPLQSNLPPVLLSDLAFPKFGPVYQPVTDNGALELTVGVEDPDPADLDRLGLRLFEMRATDTERQLLEEHGTITRQTPPDEEHPLRQTGKFLARNYCSQLGARAETVDLYVVVADREWSNQMPDHAVEGGLTAENHWELICP